MVLCCSPSLWHMQLGSAHEGSTEVTIHEASQHHFREEHITISFFFFFTLKLLLTTGRSTALGQPKGWASLQGTTLPLCYMILLPCGAAAGVCLVLVAVCHRLWHVVPDRESQEMENWSKYPVLVFSNSNAEAHSLHWTPLPVPTSGLPCFALMWVSSPM